MEFTAWPSGCNFITRMLFKDCYQLLVRLYCILYVAEKTWAVHLTQKINRICHSFILVGHSTKIALVLLTAEGHRTETFRDYC